MRTYINYVNVYNFDELSDSAKERVKNDYLDDECRKDIFEENCMFKLHELLPSSDLNIEYSLCYCQGDGFNIYGEVYFNDLIEVLKDKFSEKEMKFLQWAFKETGIDSYIMKNNRHYAYCIADTYNFMEDIADALSYYNMKNIKVDILDKMNREAKSFFYNLCKEFENCGYNFFYEISDEEVEEWADINNFEFTADGIIF